MASPSTAAAAADAPPGRSLRMFDMANLLDTMYEGVYNGKRAHEPDLACVLQRAADTGVRDILVTAGSLAESCRALALVRALRGSSPVRLTCTVGVHPTRCDEFDRSTADGVPPTTLAALLEVARDGMADGSVVAIGEIGLDYDRLHFCGKEAQARGFAAQLELAQATGLPLFLHNRNTSGDFTTVLRAHLATARSAGVVHSFDGDAAELAALLDLGMSIGINGCSMRAEPNLRIAASVPLDRLLIETDAPWCQVRPTHAGHASVATQFPEVKKEAWRSDSCVKSRNEPCHTLQVLEILAAARGEPISELGAAVYANARRLFYKDD